MSKVIRLNDVNLGRLKDMPGETWNKKFESLFLKKKEEDLVALKVEKIYTLLKPRFLQLVRAELGETEEKLEHALQSLKRSEPRF